MRYLLFIIASLLGFNAQAKNAQKIIALSPHAVEMLYAIGAGDRIVATTESSDYPEAALKIPRIGNYTGVQIERIVELQPDLIVAWKGGNKLTDLNKLESLGLPVVYSDPKTIKNISEDIEKLGELTGLKLNAHKISSDLLIRHQMIINQYKDKTKVNVFYQLWDDPLRTVGPNSWVSTLINDCNGNNLFDDANAPYPLISMESVLTRNPQVIIVQHHRKEDDKQKQIWTSWPMIDAVKNDRLMNINPDILLRPTPRALDGLEELCEAISTAR